MILKYHMRAPGPSPLSYETFCSTNERVDGDTHTATRNLRLDCGRVVPVQGYDGTISDVFYRAARIRPFDRLATQPALRELGKSACASTHPRSKRSSPPPPSPLHLDSNQAGGRRHGGAAPPR